jgi:rubrerythrin
MEMQNYVCLNCNFKFRSAKKTALCPYCNKNAAEPEKSADDLLNEVDGLLD